MKLSLLETVQNILSEMDSDEVNSINDTSESRQVAQIVRTVYFDIIARANLPEHRQLFQLTASGDASLPVLMIRPATVSKLDWVKYNVLTLDDPEDNFQYVTVLPKDQFLDMIHQFNETDTEVDTMVLNGITFYFKNDFRPTYCTIVDDQYVVFDSYDAVVDTTLQTSKSMCFGQVIPVFSLEDNFIPDIDEQQFPLLLNEAISRAFVSLKQVPHDLAVLEARRQWRTLQRTKELSKESDFDKLPNFGRK